MVIFVVRPGTARSRLPSLDPTAIVAIIPARFHSTRLPGKALADIGGHPMIEHVYRRVARAPSVAHVIVATDDGRILSAVESFGGAGMLTRADHASGTDRLAEVVRDLPCSIAVNVQGDEPLVEPDMIEEALAPIVANRDVAMSTLRRRITDPEELENPNVVKVVVDQQDDALYFSRSPIPHARRSAQPPPPAYKHIGLYAYRREFLLMLTALPQTPLELAESLEQLRALEHGCRIRAVETQHDSLGVDTPADLDRVRRIVTAGGLHAASAHRQGAHAPR